MEGVFIVLGGIALALCTRVLPKFPRHWPELLALLVLGLGLAAAYYGDEPHHFRPIDVIVTLIVVVPLYGICWVYNHLRLRWHERQEERELLQ